jgi:hypothetical protein
MPTKGTNSFAAVNVPVFQLAGFEVIFIGRFCVIAEVFGIRRCENSEAA